MVDVIIAVLIGFLLLSLFALIGLLVFEDITFIWSPFHDSCDPKFSYGEYKALGGKLNEDRYPTICGKYVRLSLIDYYRAYHEEKRNNQLRARAKIIEEATKRNEQNP